MAAPLLRYPLAVACAMLAPLALPAAEVVVRDVRGAVLIRPTDFSFDVGSPSVSGGGDDAFDSGTGFEVGARYSLAGAGSPWGLVLGGDLTADWYTYDGDLALSTFGARAALGAAYAAGDRWTLLLEAGGGFGHSTLELPATSSAPAFDASGLGTFYDLRLSAIYRPFRRWAVHGHVGHLTTSYELESGGVTVDLEQDGLFVGLGMTWLFSTKPALLE